MLLPLLAAASATLAGHSFLTIPGDQWRLVWNDEFDGSRLDPAKWSIGLPWKGDDGTNRHHNTQYASVIADEDVQVKDGMLHLTTRRTETPHPKGGTPYHYTEGLITTSGKFSTAYGYFEMRAKLPTDAGPGTWPAFWLLTNGWPPEMDILEYWGSDNRIHQGTVTRKPDGSQRWDSYHRHQVSLAGWHTFGLEWGPGYQRYNIDGKVTNRIYGGFLPTTPHYILLNSGVESQRPPLPGTTFPNDFVVDYVRVYARPSEVPALLNGDFSDDELSPWNRVGEASVGDYGAKGKRCLRADPAEDKGAGLVPAAAGAKQTVYGLVPGTTYVLTALVRSTANKTQTPARAWLAVSEANDKFFLSKPIAVTSDTRAQAISWEFHLGATASSATIAVLASGGSVFFDSVTLVPKTAPNSAAPK